MHSPEIKYTKEITFSGRHLVAACDGKCDKAFGITQRPKILLSPTDPDDCLWLGDDEVGTAPTNPGTWEGGYAKPTAYDNPETERLNRWCVRECERSLTESKFVRIRLPDGAARSANIRGHESRMPSGSLSTTPWNSVIDHIRERFDSVVRRHTVVLSDASKAPEAVRMLAEEFEKIPEALPWPASALWKNVYEGMRVQGSPNLTLSTALLASRYHGANDDDARRMLDRGLKQLKACSLAVGQQDGPPIPLFTLVDSSEVDVDNNIVRIQLSPGAIAAINANQMEGP